MAKWTWAHLWRLMGLIIFVGMLYLWHPGCVIDKTFGVECPTCGISRGCFSLMHLNFAKAWALNPLSFACPLWGIWIVMGGKMFINERANRAVLWGLVSVSAVLLLFRLTVMLINT